MALKSDITISDFNRIYIYIYIYIYVCVYYIYIYVKDVRNIKGGINENECLM